MSEDLDPDRVNDRSTFNHPRDQCLRVFYGGALFYLFATFLLWSTKFYEGSQKWRDQ